MTISRWSCIAGPIIIGDLRQRAVRWMFDDHGSVVEVKKQWCAVKRSESVFSFYDDKPYNAVWTVKLQLCINCFANTSVMAMLLQYYDRLAFSLRVPKKRSRSVGRYVSMPSHCVDGRSITHTVHKQIRFMLHWKCMSFCVCVSSIPSGEGQTAPPLNHGFKKQMTPFFFNSSIASSKFHSAIQCKQVTTNQFCLGFDSSVGYLLEIMSKKRMYLLTKHTIWEKAEKARSSWLPLVYY